MQKYFTYGDARIAYRMEGSGQPVVLLHGFGEDSQVWDTQYQFLKAHCLVILPDLPGSGKSTLLTHSPTTDHKPQSPNTQLQTPNNISIDEYAEVIYQLLQAEKISVCIMIGHSMGGYITLAFANKYPDNLQAMGLVHSTAYADSVEKKQIRQKAIGVIETYGAAAFLSNTLPNLFGPDCKKQHPEIVEAFLQKSSTFTKAALQQYYGAMMHRPDRRQVLQGNPKPVLFVIGKEDAAIPMQEMMEQTHLPSISYIHVLEKAGHMGMLEEPETLNQLILAFIHKA